MSINVAEISSGTIPQVSLTKEQREAVGLLSVGTFLEYFDLMLYVHMAVLLNELFFPKFDPFITSMLTAFTFCSTYVFRPIGALIFGWLGDNIGRKSTVIMTTFIMAICCLTMAVLPTYAEIGLISSVTMIICRIMQGMAALGEGTGAELYLTETIKPPLQYPMVAIVTIFAVIGSTVALGVASLVMSLQLSWRLIFGLGGIIALIGAVARTTLRETPDFADAKRRIKQVIKDSGKDIKILENNPIYQEKVDKKTAFSLFLIQCTRPIAFYFAYIYCGIILKSQFGFTAEQVIHQSFIVSSIHLLSCLFFAYLSYKIYPLKILKTCFILYTGFLLVCPYLLSNITSSLQLLLVQISLVLLCHSDYPAAPIFYMHFPVFKRYTFGCFTYALGRAVMYVITSFGLVYLIDLFGYWGILVVALPVAFGYKFALSHFEKLEKEAGNYPKKKNSLENKEEDLFAYSN